MNRDQIKGIGKRVEGEVEQKVGKLTGDTSTRVRGHAKEAEGRLQKGLGDAKEELRRSQRELDLERPIERERDRGRDS